MASAYPLEELLRQTLRREGYRPPTREEAGRAEEAFLSLLGGDRGERVAGALERLGFVLDSVRLGGERLAVVREAGDRREGKGLYLLRDDPEIPLAIQAPHRPSDMRTGEIAARLVAERPFAAAAWNTVPRRFESDGRTVDADLAHEPVSFFNAFTRAFARAHPRGWVVQLHGFDSEGREADLGIRAAMILSDGTRDPGPGVCRVASCLARLRAGEVLIFPGDIAELGATTNANAATLRDLGKGEFLHVEMAPELRRTLANDSDQRERFADCLTRLPR